MDITYIDAIISGWLDRIDAILDRVENITEDE